MSKNYDTIPFSINLKKNENQKLNEICDHYGIKRTEGFRKMLRIVHQLMEDGKLKEVDL